MTIKLTCTECKWSTECKVSEMPLRCPDCHAKVVRADDPKNPEDIELEGSDVDEQHNKYGGTWG